MTPSIYSRLVLGSKRTVLSCLSYICKKKLCLREESFWTTHPKHTWNAISNDVLSSVNLVDTEGRSIDWGNAVAPLRIIAARKNQMGLKS